MLWAVLLANLLAIFIQCLAAKLGIVTGKNLAELSAGYFSRPAVWAMWICSELIAMATDLAESLAASVGFALLLHAPLIAGMVITGCATCLILGLERRGSRPLELVIAGLVALIALSFVAEIVIATPIWRETAYHAVIPEISDKGAMVLVIAITGATLMPHAIYVHSGLTQNRPVLSTDQQRRRLVRFSNREVLFALGIAGIVNLSMVAMAAAAFHAGIDDRVAGIEQACRTLAPLFGGDAAVIFMLALINSGLSSSVVGTMAGQIVMQGFVGYRIPIWCRRAVTILPAFVVVAFGLKATDALILSQVVLSLGLPVPMISLFLLTRDRRVMGSFTNTRSTYALAMGVILLVIGLNTVLVLQAAGVPIV